MSGGIPWWPDVVGGTSIGTDVANGRGTAVAASNNAYGSYVQLTASSPVDAAFIQINAYTSAGSYWSVGIKIAVGGAGSERDIINDLIVPQPVAANVGNFYLPVQIPAGTRISAAASGNAGTGNAYVSATLFSGTYSSQGFAGVDAIGSANNGNRGTQITSAAGSKGSYAQLTSSTARDYAALMFQDTLYTSAGNSTDTHLVDIAIGGAGSEQIIIPDIQLLALASQGQGLGNGGSVPIAVKAGTRIAARSASFLAANSIGLIIYGLYD